LVGLHDALIPWPVGRQFTRRGGTVLVPEGVIRPILPAKSVNQMLPSGPPVIF
jgi:hypothetical protein